MFGGRVFFVLMISKFSNASSFPPFRHSELFNRMEKTLALPRLLQELRKLCLVLLAYAGLSRGRRASDLAGFNGGDRWCLDVVGKR